ncbi:MAG: threonine aldolase [Verrucomicrobiaceae bacterium]|nr:threonine aldolase [Verrucomicrobiaceae bacterium]
MRGPIQVSGLEEVPSPALLVWPGRVEANIGHMVSMCGGPSRLRPHVKTHKMDAVVRLQLAAGIDKFKAATIAEVEMCLVAGAADVLFAYPLVGPNRKRLVRLAQRYPGARLSFLAERGEGLALQGQLNEEAGVEIGVFIDFDCGMARTGTACLESAVAVGRAIDSTPGLRFEGVHAYDGHLRAGNPEERRDDWAGAMGRVEQLLQDLTEAGRPAPVVVGGGSPTFGLHAGERDWQCSPGTTLFWDAGYANSFPDLPFENAAGVLTRIISMPGSNRLCLDLGHKAIASEGPLAARVHLVGLEEARVVGHSEEHLVLEVEETAGHAVGNCVIGIPRHICPTVALFEEATLIRDGSVTGERWEVTARCRRLTV